VFRDYYSSQSSFIDIAHTLRMLILYCGYRLGVVYLCRDIMRGWIYGVAEYV